MPGRFTQLRYRSANVAGELKLAWRRTANYMRLKRKKFLMEIYHERAKELKSKIKRNAKYIEYTNEN